MLSKKNRPNRVRLALLWIISILGGCVIVTTILPLFRVDAGFVRIWDFPRPQLAALGFAAIVGLLALRVWRRRWGAILLAGLAIAAGFQSFRIFPYTPLVDTQVKSARQPAAANCVSILSANVYQKNRDQLRILDMISTLRPDIVLLLETDDWWHAALKPAIKSYPHSRIAIFDNTYGLIFMTKLEGHAAIRYLVKDDIPSVKADLLLPSGRNFTFFGLHPEPPMLSQSTEERDSELMIIARELHNQSTAAIVAGDLNDVAWSHTTRLFRSISRMIDPRIGRGLYASFHATYKLMRWPLDHLFHSDDFLLSRIEILPNIGADHFPVFGRLCMAPDAASRNGAPERSSAADRKEARDAIREGRGELAPNVGPG